MEKSLQTKHFTRMGILLGSCQKNKSNIDLYSSFSLELIETVFYDAFKEFEHGQKKEPSFAIDKDEWMSAMKELFRAISCNFPYFQPRIAEVDYIAAELFFTKIKCHAPDDPKGLMDGNKRSAIFAVLIHYISYRALELELAGKSYEDIKKGIANNISKDEMYQKAKDVASLDSLRINDTEEKYVLEKWFNNSEKKSIWKSFSGVLKSLGEKKDSGSGI